MNGKLIVLIVVALALLLLIINEIMTLKSEMNKHVNAIETSIEKHNTEYLQVLKKEINNSNAKYKTYTNEMLQQIRTMNNLEKQNITVMSDRFVEAGSSYDKNNKNDEHGNHILYLSELSPVQAHRKEELYMSDTSSALYGTTKDNKLTSHKKNENLDEFAIRDENNDLLNSAKFNPTKKYTKITTQHNIIDTGNVQIMSSNGLNNNQMNTGNITCNIADRNEHEQEEGDEDEDEQDEDEGEEDEQEEEEDGEEEQEDDEGEEDEQEEDEGEEDEQEEDEQEEQDEDENCEIHCTTNNTVGNVNTKLQQLKKLKQTMEEQNDELSQDITFGNSKKGTITTIKSGNKSTFDNLSMGTTDSQIKLKSISSYSKKDLEDMANKRGILIPPKANKNVIYDAIKSSI
jgi:hypothetical protein